MHQFTADIIQKCSIILLFLLIACEPGGQKPPDAPGNVTATAGDTTVTLAWSPVAGAVDDSYNIYWSYDSNLTLKNGTLIGSVKSPYIHQDLSNGKTYYYRVTARASFGEGHASEVVSVVPQPPPLPPQKVTVTPGNKTATLAWLDVENAQNYNLYVATEPGLSPQNYNTLSGGVKFTGVTSPYQATGLTNGVTYYYVVTALSPGGESEASIPVSVVPTNIISIAIGRWHTCVIKVEGSLWCWGRNNYGQLGDGAKADQSTPVQIGAADWQAIAAGSDHTCALKKNSSLWCWGRNNYTPPGYTSAYQATPVQIGLTMDWQAITAVGNHTCALKKNGSLWCWVYPYGPPSYDSVNQSKSFRIGGAMDWKTISGTCAIKKEGSLWCSVTKNNKLEQIQIGVTMDWKAISGSCAIKNEGSLWCWGKNQYGQLGDNTTTDQPTPIQIGTSMDWQAIAGGFHDCAVKREGSLWCWGANGSGQPGDSATANQSKPMQIDAALDWQGIAMGESNICSFKIDGSLWCWGDNSFGQLGNGNTVSRSKPVKIDASMDWQAIAAGSDHTCALKKEGSLWCWGRNNVGQLGDGTMADPSTPVQIGTTPVQIGAALDWQTITAGNAHTCALKKEGSLWCWGNNQEGQLGDGTTVNQSKPVQIGATFDWQTIAAGYFSTCALKKDSSLWCWGTDVLSGQIISQPSTPMQIGMDMDWQAIAVGSYQTCALKKEGSLWCLRNTGSDLLADGTRGAVQYQPVQIEISTDWQAIATSPFHTCALKKEGSLWCWGRNDYGQLGNGTASLYSSSTLEQMVQIDMDMDWQAIAVGPYNTCALKKEGSLWCWGRNQYGALGDGTTVDKWEPSPVSNFPSGSQIAIEQVRTCSVDMNGFLWCWGINFELLQSESSTSRITPQRVKLP